MTNRPEFDDDLDDGPFAVWPQQDGTEADARTYHAVTVRQAAEQCARVDYGDHEASAWPITYRVRDKQTGQLWMVLVDVVPKPSFVAIEARAVPMPPATHVLWGGRVLCEDLRLRGVPHDWPEGQRWISLKDFADEAEAPPDRCEACWKKGRGLVTGLRLIGAAR